MDSTKTEIIIFIQRWIYHAGKSDEKNIFVGADALFDGNQRMYFASEIEYTFVYESIPGLAEASPGDIYRVTAAEEDSAYGHQWRIASADRIESAMVHEIRKFLMQVKGRYITSKSCSELVNAYGAKTLDTILADRSALDFLKIKQNSKDRIYHTIAENRGFANLLAFLTKRNWDCRLALPLYITYGDKALSTIRTEPYRIYQDHLTSFLTADWIFLNLGGAADAPRRCQNAVRAALQKEEARNGGSFILRKELREKISRLPEDDTPHDCTLAEDDISKALDWLEESGEVHTDRINGVEAVYPSQLYYAEVDVAEGLKVLCQAKKWVTCSVHQIDRFLESYGASTGLKLTPNQCAAVRQMLAAPVSIITGGPGTGKTLLIKAALDTLEELCPRAVVQCCSLTGKAAERMPAEACTIDRLTKNEQWKYANRYSRDEPDLFIVDEVSMVDIKRFQELLAVIPTGARLVLIGDQEQLPSIDAGQVLRDIIDSGVIRTVHLREVFRQEMGSAIRSNAAKIIQTAEDQDIHLDETGAGFDFNKRISDPCKIAEAVVLTYEKLLEGGTPPAAVQVITRQQKGELGTQNLNHLLQDRLNPQKDEDKFFCDGKEFRLRDRVIHTRNNYKKEVFNGEVGAIVEIHRTREWVLTVQYPSKLVKYAEADLKDLELAYALTAHKCQGSEYGVVIIPIAGKGITRRILYTAVTRGRERVLLIGTESALSAEMRGETSDERASHLALRLRQLLPPILPEAEQISLFPSDLSVLNPACPESAPNPVESRP